MRWLLLQQVLLPLAGPAPAAVRGVLPAANFSRVPVSSWCGNQSGPLSVSVAQTFATRPLVVFEKDMAQSSPPVGACEELKISAAAAQVRDASAVLRPDGPATQVLMYFTVGSLLPQYTLSKWFEAHSNLMLHDDDGRLVTVSYSLGCPSHRPHEPCGAPVAVPWVDFSQPAAADAWVNGVYRWVANRSVDGIALDSNPFEDEWVREVASTGGSPGILENVSSLAKRQAFFAGLNTSEAQLGAKISQGGGVLSSLPLHSPHLLSALTFPVANGVHKIGDNGMLFEEWCDEHSYLRRSHGCNGSTSPVVCDMAILQQFSSDPQHVALVHIPDGGNGMVPIAMSGTGVLKLAAFLWGAGPRAFFADVPPLKGEKAHWQCDEWAAMPKFQELEKPLGLPTTLGLQPRPGLFTRSFGTAGARARVTLQLSNKAAMACIVWADGSHSVSSSSSAALCDATHV